MEPLNVTLPWPPSLLSPNQRVHWSPLARAKGRYRFACGALTTQAACGQKMDASDRLHLHLTFVPPDRSKRDLDNLIASMKSGLDGIADALGVDDSRWALSFAMLDTGDIGGMVKVRIEKVPS